MNEFETIKYQEKGYGHEITFIRDAHNNAINRQLLLEFNELLNKIEKKSERALIIISGNKKTFCSGMDLNEAAENILEEGCESNNDLLLSEQYLATLKRMTTNGCVFISVVEGQVLAGGVGIVAASDIVIAGSGATFALSEALWGLIPACVTPYLIRRVGFQKAYHMTLTTMPVDIEKAYTMGLVDEVSSSPMLTVKQYAQRLTRISCETTSAIKNYFRNMWILDKEMEAYALNSIGVLVQDDKVRKNLLNYVKYKILPWENK